MRDKIAEIITYADAYDDTLATANLIVRSLPDILRERIPSLEWVARNLNSKKLTLDAECSSTKMILFRIFVSEDGCQMTDNMMCFTSWHKTEDEAKTVANHRHASRIMRDIRV